MSQILLEFDNKLKQSEIQIPLTRSSEEESGQYYEYNNSDKQQTLTYGIITPLIKINNIVIDFLDVEYFDLDMRGTLPKLTCTVIDRYNFIKILDQPKNDNEIRVQILPQFDNAYKKINLTFQITKITVGDSVTVSGSYKVPKLLSSQRESFGKIDTYNLFKQVAIKTNLGFATNCKEMTDKRYIYTSNQTYTELLSQEIEISESDANHIYDWWVDCWNNINLVNIYDRYNTIEEDKDMMVWVSGEMGQMSPGKKITPQHVPALLSNNPVMGNTELNVTDYEIVNKPGTYTSAGTDKVYTTYFETTGTYNDFLIMDGDVKKDIYEHYEYLGEVYGDYNYLLAQKCREAYLQKMNTESVKVYLKSPLLCLARGMKVNFVWYTNDSHMDAQYAAIKDAGGMNNVQTTPILDDTINENAPDYVPRPMKEFTKDESISGQYMISGVDITYEDNSWTCELTLNRPASQKPQLLTELEES